MNVHLSDLISAILEPLANSIKGSWKLISTEDLLNNIETFNDKTEDGGGGTPK